MLEIIFDKYFLSDNKYDVNYEKIWQESAKERKQVDFNVFVIANQIQKIYFYNNYKELIIACYVTYFPLNNPYNIYKHFKNYLKNKENKND